MLYTHAYMHKYLVACMKSPFIKKVVKIRSNNLKSYGQSQSYIVQVQLMIIQIDTITTTSTTSLYLTMWG